jgi:TorA maturation chaperone TorD
LPDWRPKAELPSPEYPYYYLTYIPPHAPPQFHPKQHRSPRNDAHPYRQHEPQLAQKLGIHAGQRVRIRSRVGAIELPAHLTETLRPDCVMVAHGFGHVSHAMRLAGGHGARDGDVIPSRSIEELIATKNFTGSGCIMDAVVAIAPLSAFVMTPSPVQRAPCYAFAGRALLSASAAELRELLTELSATSNGALASLLSNLTASLPGDTLTLETEYNRLFLNPMGSPCQLWQSAHEEEARLMGASHHRALAWYRTAGVEPVLADEPADHAGLLLSFYALLLATGANQHDCHRFFHDHLQGLAPLSNDLERAARHPFYGHLAQLLRLLLAQR